MAAARATTGRRAVSTTDVGAAAEATRGAGEARVAQSVEGEQQRVYDAGVDGATEGGGGSDGREPVRGEHGVQRRGGRYGEGAGELGDGGRFCLVHQLGKAMARV